MGRLEIWRDSRTEITLDTKRAQRTPMESKREAIRRSRSPTCWLTRYDGTLKLLVLVQGCNFLSVRVSWWIKMFDSSTFDTDCASAPNVNSFSSHLQRFMRDNFNRSLSIIWFWRGDNSIPVWISFLSELKTQPIKIISTLFYLFISEKCVFCSCAPDLSRDNQYVVCRYFCDIELLRFCNEKVWLFNVYKLYQLFILLQLSFSHTHTTNSQDLPLPPPTFFLLFFFCLAKLFCPKLATNVCALPPPKKKKKKWTGPISLWTVLEIESYSWHQQILYSSRIMYFVFIMDINCYGRDSKVVVCLFILFVCLFPSIKNTTKCNEIIIHCLRLDSPIHSVKLPISWHHCFSGGSNVSVKLMRCMEI